MVNNNVVTVFREDYKNYNEYLNRYRECCRVYNYKSRVFGGWKFFAFLTDQNIWKNQK